MSKITTVGLDLAKHVFQAHGADGSGRAVLRKKLQRDQVLDFFVRLPACIVAMEAEPRQGCAASRHSARASPQETQTAKPPKSR